MEQENKVVEEQKKEEPKVEKKEKTKKKSILVPLLFILAIALISGGIVLTFTSEPTPQEETPQKPITEEEQQEVSSVKTIELTNEIEELFVDPNLTIKFTGVKDPTKSEGYQYKADIYFNNELINHNFFNGNNIWSTNYGATFEVVNLLNTYIIKSFIAKQCNGSYVLVISHDKQITTYDDVIISINEPENKYTISKCGDCMNENTCSTETISVTTPIK